MKKEKRKKEKRKKRWKWGKWESGDVGGKWGVRGKLQNIYIYFGSAKKNASITRDFCSGYKNDFW